VFTPGDDALAPNHVDLSREHVLAAVEGSLRRLATDYLDILLLHWADPLMDPAEVAAAFDELHDSGKVRYFGVSNWGAPQIELLLEHVDRPLVANQVQISLAYAKLLLECMVTMVDEPGPERAEGTLECCHRHGIVPQAWSPLATGTITQDDPPEDLEQVARTVRLIAERHDVPREAVAIAWLLQHPAGIQPLVGSRTPERIGAACRGESLDLTREEWFALYVAARGRKII
jgi:predicted oxidoreductase